MTSSPGPAEIILWHCSFKEEETVIIVLHKRRLETFMYFTAHAMWTKQRIRTKDLPHFLCANFVTKSSLSWVYVVEQQYRYPLPSLSTPTKSCSLYASSLNHNSSEISFSLPGKQWFQASGHRATSSAPGGGTTNKQGWAHVYSPTWPWPAPSFMQVNQFGLAPKINYVDSIP
jgi:hypothetical protein